MKAFLVLQFFFILSFFEGIITSTSWNKYCHRYPCPRYKVLNKTRDYEVRQYPMSRWAVAHSQGVDLYWATLQNKAKLSRYRLGKNEENVKMSTTYPSVIRIINPKRASEWIKEFTSMYYIPDKFQNTCPTPLSKGGETEVDLMEWESRIAYVVSFSRWITDSWLRYYTRHLSDSLKRAGIEFEEYYVYYSSYNKKGQYYHRHEEIMFLKQQPSLNKIKK